MEPSNRTYNDYIASLFAPQDTALAETVAQMQRENVPAINLSPAEGKLLQVLAILVGAKRILEIGTLGGYSGIHLARTLPEDGRLITLELDPHHAEVARRNFESAGVENKATVHVGPAADTLRQLAEESEPPFDLIFIDADKESYPQYLELSLPLLREGGLLAADNVLSHSTLDARSDNDIDRFNSAVASHPDLISIIVPTLGNRGGMGGMMVSVKRTS
ncbi:putative O-methyltransferase/MSMEI_4947 [Abditibacteriota bacterium]|nr:putative O-methyltransferase/MSMEI_4947 [Abditibacteriota bacterium]